MRKTLEYKKGFNDGQDSIRIINTAITYVPFWIFIGLVSLCFSTIVKRKGVGK